MGYREGPGLGLYGVKGHQGNVSLFYIFIDKVVGSFC